MESVPQVLQFDPPYPVFKIVVGDEVERVIKEPLMVLESKQRIAIPNPWADEDEERYLPGIAYGKDGEFLMDVGESFGSLKFHEEAGWFCIALIPKNDVMGPVVDQLMDNVTKGSYTQRLLKRSKGKKKK